MSENNIKKSKAYRKSDEFILAKTRHRRSSWALFFSLFAIVIPFLYFAAAYQFEHHFYPLWNYHISIFIFLAKTIADFCFSVIVSPSISLVVFVSSAKDSNLQKSFICCFAAAEALPPLLAISFLSLAGLVFSGFKLLSFISIVTFCKNSVFLFVGSLLSAWCWVGQGVGWSPVSVLLIGLRAGNGVRSVRGGRHGAGLVKVSAVACVGVCHNAEGWKWCPLVWFPVVGIIPSADGGFRPIPPVVLVSCWRLETVSALVRWSAWC